MNTPNDEIDEEERELALLEASKVLELGRIEYAQGNLDAALECYEWALAQFELLKNRNRTARALSEIGSLYQTR